VIEIVSSSQIHVPVNTALPELKGMRPIESRILQYFYQDGLTYKQIGKKLRKKESYVKRTIRRAREKYGAIYSNSERLKNE
jgi:DNA-directed RNA polymerase specialized sigma24 family protein